MHASLQSSGVTDHLAEGGDSLTLLNTGQGTLFPCGNNVVTTKRDGTPLKRAKKSPAMPVPDMVTILRLYAMRAYVFSGC